MRKKKIWIYIAAISVMMTLFFSYDRIQLYIKETTIPNYKELSGIGYNQQQITIINQQTDDELSAILKAEYQPDIVRRLTVAHYATLKDKGYTEEDLKIILVSDEKLLIALEALVHLERWKEYLSQPIYRSIIDAGYPETIGIVLFEMKEVDFPSVLSYGYDPAYDDLIQSPYTVPPDLADYLAYWKTHSKLHYRQVQEIINTENDRAKYTDIENADITQGNLILVNKYYRLASTFVPQNLTSVSVCGKATMISEATNALRLMCSAMIAEGLHPKVTSSYRSYNTQAILYNRYVSQDGSGEADTYSARPGFSEHQTGLAVDIISNNSSLSSFKNTPEARWMLAHAQDYGFILRYPSSKQTITGYISEPWHWRYVTKEIALDFNTKALTFDEYYRVYIE